MTPGCDLSNLHVDQADMWFYLQADAILAEIVADQPERRTSPLALGAAQHCCPRFATPGGNQQHITGGRLVGVSLGNEKVN